MTDPVEPAEPIHPTDPTDRTDPTAAAAADAPTATAASPDDASPATSPAPVPVPPLDSAALAARAAEIAVRAAKLWKTYVKRLYADRLPRAIDREALVLAVRRAIERSDLKLVRIGPEEDPGRSYSLIEIRQSDKQRIDVLTVFGIVGFAAPPSAGKNRHWAWKQCPVLAEALTTHYPDFTVASPAELATPLTAAMLADLLPADRKLLQAHQPETLGNVIFHSVELEEAE